MAQFSGIVELFVQEGISSRKELQEILCTDENYQRYKSLCKALSGYLNSVSLSLDEEYQSEGILQFSYSPSARLREDDILKALFLARRSTVFMPGTVKYERGDYYGSFGGPGEEYQIDRDYTETLFRFRDAIAEGGLIALPSHIYYNRSRHADPTIYKHADLARKISQTRVRSVEVGPELLATVLREYRLSRQVVALPELSVPWIAGMDRQRILRLREDAHDEVLQFQRSYHLALTDYIEALGSLDFDLISRQIARDIVSPAVHSIERKYLNIVKQSRSLQLASVAVATLPVLGVLVTSIALQQPLLQSLADAAGSAVASTLGAATLNQLEKKNQKESLKTESYYLIWALGRQRDVS